MTAVLTYVRKLLVKWLSDRRTRRRKAKRHIISRWQLLVAAAGVVCTGPLANVYEVRGAMIAPSARRLCSGGITSNRGVPSFRSLLFLLLLLVTIAISGTFASASASTSSTLNPYKTLGLPKSADQATIRRRYKKLCLKYHPDKNVDRPESERKQCEEAFKKVQRANELIGDEDSRRRYDRQSAFGGTFGGSAAAAAGAGSSGSPFGGSYNPYQGDPFGAYSSSYYHRRPRRRTAIYVNGVDISHLFQSGGFPINFPFFGNPSSMGSAGQADEDMPKSTYVEKITIPLEELYWGVDNKFLRLQDNILKRFVAAFRGGSFKRVALQAAVSSLPLIFRTSTPLTALAFVICFSIGLPRPSRNVFPTQIRPGWKAGTKIKYAANEETGFCEVVFVIREGKHEKYVREGNNLRTTVAISKAKARKGSQILVEPLSSQHELPIKINLQPGEVDPDAASSNGNYVKIVKGRGWPGRKGRGDLLVEIALDSSLRKEETRRTSKKRRRSKRGQE